MHTIDIHVFWQKYTHTDTHTQTRNTCAYTYPSTQSSHRHTKKHKTPTYMHQQAQTQACTTRDCVLWEVHRPSVHHSGIDLKVVTQSIDMPEQHLEVPFCTEAEIL